MRAPLLTFVSAVALLVAAAPAYAAKPRVKECLTAAEASVALRTQHKLRAARAQLLVCSAASCPAEVRDECAHRVDDVNTALPSIVFTVQDAMGRELTAVTVTMDGEVLTDHLDGSALTLDPGSHELSFNADGQLPFTETLIIHEGEKNRRELVKLGPPTASATSVAADAPSPTGLVVDSAADAESPSALRDLRRKQRLIGVVGSSVGVVGVALGGIFGGLTFSTWSHANNECPAHRACSAAATHDRDNAATYGTVSTVGFIAGGLLLAGSITLYFTAPSASSPHVGVRLSPQSLGLAGTF
jgi:hypothetical protein